MLDQVTLAAGCLTRRALTAAEAADARIGWQACRAIGAIDVGQTIVVSQGLVVAVEAVEGTDAAIRRAGELAGKGSVVIKLCKPGQDTRIDLPTVGVKTIETMAASGASALVLEAKKSIILDPDAVAREANQLGIAIELAAGIEDLSR
ncbi:MAG: LpxI family protein [Deltaproteobacteria bacterium]|nr:LpxI family protein [Deltaproteobacteria bacterium]